jgi:hypothetical protein
MRSAGMRHSPLSKSIWPLRFAQFARPHEDQRCQLQRTSRSEETPIRINGAQQFSDPLRFDD